MKKKLKKLIPAVSLVVLLCMMVLSVSALTHSKYVDTRYEKINIKSSVQANFDGNSYFFKRAYIAIRYDATEHNANLEAFPLYDNLDVFISVVGYTPGEGYFYLVNNSFSRLYINDPERDYVGYDFNFDVSRDPVSKLFCTYSASLYNEDTHEIIYIDIPDILATRSSLNENL